VHKTYDLTIIGGGPGGYVAAIEAAKQGLSVALIEKSDLGGTCLNWGCIPTKSLLKAGEVVKKIKNADSWGIKASIDEIDIKKMVSQSRDTVKKLTNGISYLVKKNKIDLIKGKAENLKTKNNEISLQVNGKEVVSKNCIIATGARQRTIPTLPFSNLIWKTEKAMMPETIPKKLAIIGAGAIGVEFGCFYSNIGSKVSIFEMSKEIVPSLDKEISKVLRSEMEKDGIKFFLDTQSKIKEENGKVIVEFNGKTEEFDALIMAIGVIPNVENLNSEIKLENGYVQTNDFHMTNLNNVYAIGDCASPPWLAHKASHEGIRVIKKIKKEALQKLGPIPSCIYTSPQIASIGLSEEECKKLGKDIKIGRFGLEANGKALAMQDSKGLMKVIFDAKTSEMLGFHAVGPEVTEMIHSISLGMQMEALEEDWFNVIFPHPTISEAMQEAILSAFGKEIHA